MSTTEKSMELARLVHRQEEAINRIAAVIQQSSLLFRALPIGQIKGLREFAAVKKETLASLRCSLETLLDSVPSSFKKADIDGLTSAKRAFDALGKGELRSVSVGVIVNHSCYLLKVFERTERGYSMEQVRLVSLIKLSVRDFIEPLMAQELEATTSDIQTCIDQLEIIASLTLEQRSEVRMESFSLAEAAEAARDRQAKFAAMREIRIDLLDRSSGFILFGPRLSLVRAFSNVLNNAIKYTFSSSRVQTWVKIRLSSTEEVGCIEFENWGTAITKAEIESGSIFVHGSRGKYARESRVRGSGIGLTEAKEMIDAWGGKISLSSESRSKLKGRNVGHRGPFVTTVKICLPQRSRPEIGR